MLGGSLVDHAVQYDEEKSHIIAPYDNNYYIFSKEKGAVIGRVDEHEGNIVASFLDDNGHLHSIDSNGRYIQLELDIQAHPHIIQKHHISLPIQHARFLSAKTILIISHQHLHQYNTHTHTHSIMFPHVQVSSILHTQQYTVVSTTNNTIMIIDTESGEIVQEYEHGCAVSSAVVNEIGDLIVGDVRGKITHIYKYIAEGKHSMRILYQWHTGVVRTLALNGEYLYSGGEEGVLVLWHLRELTKDFIPRLGSAITNVTIHPSNNHLLLTLSNRSIQLVELNNDKHTHTYYTILYNPTSSNKLVANSSPSHVCISSHYGYLQFIHKHKVELLDILGRNYVGSIDGNHPEYHSVQSMCFSGEVMVLVVGRKNWVNSLRFYHLGVDGYKLVNKVEDAHKGAIQAVYEHNDGFITFSREDEKVRRWRRQHRKKESILEVREEFWACEWEFGFRGKLPLHVSVQQQTAAITYQEQTVLIQSNTLIKHIQHHQSIIASYILSSSTMLVHTSDSFAIWQLGKDSMKVMMRLSDICNIRLACKNSICAIIFNRQNPDHTYLGIIHNKALQKVVEIPHQVIQIHWHEHGRLVCLLENGRVMMINTNTMKEVAMIECEGTHTAQSLSTASQSVPHNPSITQLYQLHMERQHLFNVSEWQSSRSHSLARDVQQILNSNML